jgi:hypothetical protein
MHHLKIMAIKVLHLLSTLLLKCNATLMSLTAAITNSAIQGLDPGQRRAIIKHRNVTNLFGRKAA